MNLLRPILGVVFGLSVGEYVLASDDSDPFNDPALIVFDSARQNEHGKFIELEKLELKERDHHSKKVELSSSCGSCKIVIDKLNKLCESCRQPEANELLASIDSLKLDEEFFKSAFGISDKCNLRLGTDKEGNPCPIITIQSDEHYGEIMEAFDRLASNVVGQQLLARILIEIMRQDKQGKSCEEFIYSMASCLDELYRHVVCSLRINADTTTMSTENGRFEFQLEEGCSPSINIQDIGTRASARSSSLFHEMLHWYHLLRCKYRYISEHAVQESYIDKLMYSLKSNIFAIHFLKSWFPGRNRDNVNFEEMRTIIGAHPHGGDYMNPYVIDKNFHWFGFLNGDELSENLYRKSLGLTLRTAHTSIVDGSSDMVNKLLQLYP